MSRLVIVFRLFAATVILISVTLVVGLFWPTTYNPRANPLVVYCAHDSVYSEQLLRRFERETGIRVAPRFDTEATKSLGLVELISRERDNPRCDVFWNNEQLGTMRLADQGLLEPYKGPGYERIPAAFKDPDGRWTGFAARMRIWIVNTDRMDATPENVMGVFGHSDLSRFAFAKPLYGTTRTHMAVLWNEMGEDKLKASHAGWIDRGAVVAGGNAMVKDLVAAGTCDYGWTDTDDYFVAKDAGLPVRMLPFHLPPDKSILIPNTVAIVKGTTRLERAQRLVDFLLSEQTELELAASKARQIPLGPVDESKLGEEVRLLKEWSRNPYPLSGLGNSAEECLAWLRREYLGE